MKVLMLMLVSALPALCDACLIIDRASYTGNAEYVVEGHNQCTNKAPGTGADYWVRIAYYDREGVRIGIIGLRVEQLGGGERFRSRGYLPIVPEYDRVASLQVYSIEEVKR